jgi:hypothetical protein
MLVVIRITVLSSRIIRGVTAGILIGMSVKKTEKPEGNGVAGADFKVVSNDEAVFDAADLPESLAFTTDFECVHVVNEKITLG